MAGSGDVMLCSSRVRRDHRVLARDGTSLAVTQWAGPDTVRTVVFLHGLCLNHNAWNIQIDHVLHWFGDDTQVIGYDQRGHGNSASAPIHTYRVDQLADDLDQVLTTFNVTGPITLIGHSLGAMVALAFLSHTERACAASICGLVLCASAAGRLPEHGIGRLLNAPALGALVTLADRAPAATARALTTPLRIALDNLRTRGSIQRQTLAAVTANALANTPLSTAVGYLPSLRDFDVRPGLSGIAARTTILSGGLDVLTPPAHSEAMASAIPDAVHLHVGTAGHMLPQQAPLLVSNAIIDTINAASDFAMAGIAS